MHKIQGQYKKYTLGVNNEEMKSETTIYLKTIPKNIKCLGTKLTINVRPTIKKYKILLRSGKEALKERVIPCSWIRRLNLVNISILHQHDL